jgi:hypothetical protein
VDMNDTIVPKSDQLNADEFMPPGPGGARDFTITEVRITDSEQPVWIYLAEHPQPWKPALTVRRLLVLGWGPDQTTYIGRRVRLFNDPTIKWAGKAVGGIRMSHMSHIKKKITASLSETKGKRVPHVIEPLPEVAPAQAAASVDLLPGRITEAVRAWAGKGVILGQLEERAGTTVDLWTPDTLNMFQALWRSLAAGDVTVAQVFAPVQPAPPGEPSEEEQEAAFLAEQERTNRG